MDADVRSFIVASFSSIWSLELLLHLQEAPTRAFSPQELVDALRASDVVVAKAGDALVAAGLVVEEEGGRLRYAPASPALARLAQAAAGSYRRRPDAVRRLIIGGVGRDVAAFADAFRLRRDGE